MNCVLFIMNRLFISLLIACLAAIPAAAQHTLDSLYMFVTLHRDGSAEIQEQRYMTIGNDGTECFIKMYNMGDMDVSDLQVWEEGKNDDGRDTIFTYVNDNGWEVNRSRSQKAFHCGINEVADGKELCWGVGSSGYHAYIVEYVVKGLVKGYSDFDGFNHNFYQAANPPAEDARIIIYLDPSDYKRVMARTADSLFVVPIMEKQCDVKEGVLRVMDRDDSTQVQYYKLEDMYVLQDTLGSDTASIWAFGFYGYIKFNDGRIVAQTSQSMGQDDKMIVMCRFKKGLFEPTLTYPDKSFEKDVRELAFIDSDYPDNDEGNGSLASLFGGDDTPMWQRILYAVIGGLCCIGLPLFLIIYALFGKSIRRWSDRRRIRKMLGDAPEYFYEPPLGGNLLQSRRILRAMESGIDGSEMKLVEAYVLRLVDRKLITLDYTQNAKGEMEQLFRITNPQTAFSTLGNSSEDQRLLANLHSLLYQAAGEDHLLQPKEFKQLVKNDPVAVRSFARKLRDLNGVELRAKQVKKDDAQQVYGFWKYLKDFTLSAERALQEVTLWKEYLTFATLFGIADQVRADMKRIAPDLQAFDELTRRILDDQSSAVLYSALSSSIMDAAHRTINYETDAERLARIARERAARRSGSGGRSSFGGGGGFSGGGGSGVR